MAFKKDRNPLKKVFKKDRNPLKKAFKKDRNPLKRIGTPGEARKQQGD